MLECVCFSLHSPLLTALFTIATHRLSHSFPLTKWFSQIFGFSIALPSSILRFKLFVVFLYLSFDGAIMDWDKNYDNFFYALLFYGVAILSLSARNRQNERRLIQRFPPASVIRFICTPLFARRSLRSFVVYFAAH